MNQIKKKFISKKPKIIALLIILIVPVYISGCEGNFFVKPTWDPGIKVGFQETEKKKSYPTTSVQPYGEKECIGLLSTNYIQEMFTKTKLAKWPDDSFHKYLILFLNQFPVKDGGKIQTYFDINTFFSVEVYALLYPRVAPLASCLIKHYKNNKPK